MLSKTLRRLRGKYKQVLAQRDLVNWSKFNDKYDVDLAFSEATRLFNNRNDLYAYAHHYFHHLLAEELRDHRYYFSTEKRGFGEDAFHAMWWMLIREFQPRDVLEIGVYRGQVISLWGLISKLLGLSSMNVHGISPFSQVGDAVSGYPVDIDYLEDTLQNFRAFGLESPVLVKALSTDMKAIRHIREREWDLIYIDGCHDYEVALSDYQICVHQLRDQGLLVIDDSSLGTEFSPPRFAFAGHPGPSRLVQEHVMKDLTFLGSVGHQSVFQKP